MIRARVSRTEKDKFGVTMVYEAVMETDSAMHKDVPAMLSKIVRDAKNESDNLGMTPTLPESAQDLADED